MAQQAQAFLQGVLHLNDYLRLVNLDDGTYGLSYDVSTRNTEDSLPAGWGAARVNTYRQLAIRLEQDQFRRLQKSDWVRNETTAVETFCTMLMLRDIPPPGKLQSTIQGLKMHYITDWAFDISQKVRIGGEFADELAGPTPAGLVPDDIVGVPPPDHFPLPRYTKNTPAALDPQNWRVNPNMAMP